MLNILKHGSILLTLCDILIPRFLDIPDPKHPRVHKLILSLFLSPIFSKKLSNHITLRQLTTNQSQLLDSAQYCRWYAVF